MILMYKSNTYYEFAHFSKEGLINQSVTLSAQNKVWESLFNVRKSADSTRSWRIYYIILGQEMPLSIY